MLILIKYKWLRWKGEEIFVKYDGEPMDLRKRRAIDFLEKIFDVESEEEMIQGIKEKDIRDFEKYAQKLSDTMKRIREYSPKANAFLAMEELHLMSRCFQELEINEQQDFSVVSVHMEGFDGGDW